MGRKCNHTYTPYRNRDYLLNEYVVKCYSAAEIADMHGVHENAILYWLAKHGIRRRSISDARKVKYWGAVGYDNPMYGMSGHLNPNWKGGVTADRQLVYESEEWKAVALTVRRRDGYKCRRCGKHRPIHLHHVKSWAEYPESRLEPGNLVSLCKPCHNWVHSLNNFKREWRS